MGHPHAHHLLRLCLCELGHPGRHLRDVLPNPRDHFLCQQHRRGSDCNHQPYLPDKGRIRFHVFHRGMLEAIQVPLGVYLYEYAVLH